MELKPAATNASSNLNDVDSSAVHPNTFPPKTNGEISSPEFPSLRFFTSILSTLALHIRPNVLDEIPTTKGTWTPIRETRRAILSSPPEYCSRACVLRLEHHWTETARACRIAWKIGGGIASGFYIARRARLPWPPNVSRALCRTAIRLCRHDQCARRAPRSLSGRSSNHPPADRAPISVGRWIHSVPIFDWRGRRKTCADRIRIHAQSGPSNDLYFHAG